MVCIPTTSSLGLSQSLFAVTLCLIGAAADATKFEIARTVTADCASTELTIAWRLDTTK